MKEEIIKIYQRAMQYCVAKYGSEPDRLQIEEDGGFKATWEFCSCGEWDHTNEYFNAEVLSEDLDEVYQKRKYEEAEKARIRRENEEIERKRQEEISKKRRFQQYLQLKKEFETN